MKVGTKSILFGIHQFLIHPMFVLFAWIRLYGLPNWKELICIFIHDIGYWGCNSIDGKEGVNHPLLGAKIAGKLFGTYYYYLCLGHSRSCAKNNNLQPSKLCWPDKLIIFYEPWWFYLPRAILSGEIKELRQNFHASNIVPLSATNKEWYNTCSELGGLTKQMIIEYSKEYKY